MSKSTRDKLLDYSFEEIHKYGYFQANTSAILKRAKIPKGSMYHYFSSKHDLALSVIHERVKPKTLKNYKIKVEGSYIDSLITFLEGIDFSKKSYYHGCVMHKLIVEMSSHDKRFKEALDAIVSEVLLHFEGLLEGAIKKGEIKKCDTTHKANLILTTLLGAISLKNSVALQALIKELSTLKLTKKQAKQPQQQSLF